MYTLFLKINIFNKNSNIIYNHLKKRMRSCLRATENFYFKINIASLPVLVNSYKQIK